MAADQEKPTPKRKKTAKKKPSFEAPVAGPSSAGWVYRTDKPSATETATPAPKPAATSRGRAAAAQAATPKPAAARPRPASVRKPGLVTSVLDGMAVPFGIALMAVLAPIGRRR
jgi:hypothetical protein